MISLDLPAVFTITLTADRERPAKTDSTLTNSTQSNGTQPVLALVRPQYGLCFFLI